MVHFVLAACLAAMAPDDSLKPVAFDVSGITCIVCARSIEARLQKLPEVHGLAIMLANRRVSMDIDAERVPLQRITAAIAGPDGKFTPRLVLQPGDPAGFPALKEALNKVKGVRHVREPNDSGRFLVDLRQEETTYLSDINRAADSAHVPLVAQRPDPAILKPPGR